uniref:Peptide-N(4)-(N-acetyl-beta-glucosaminyl) asparagine amidase isoform X1 n=1 Tax=Tanacetum cinerariifolium TaxID=118510 RepID=A0A6L2J6D2_TANCI|nr:peptide-N(4)-(N-acetyl-beta-glucosaminyl) asparagine amidase isoform X1 [Tanacetum cinerariifolium]
MVVKKLRVHHENSELKVEYETEDGLEVLKFQLFSLTQVPPDEQKILGGEDDRLISHDSDLLSQNLLRLIHIHHKSDEEFARMLQAEEALMLQQQLLAVSADNDQFQHRLGPYVNQILMYEDPHRQEAARRTLHVEKLEEKALVALAKDGNFNPSKSELDHAFLLQLLFWFKQTFKWVNSPSCEGCGNETSNRGMGVANSSETAYGASRVELYGCNVCSRTTRFPRYNDPLKLLETKKGRCGEWANCFSLYCRSFGYETRLVVFADSKLRDLPIYSFWQFLRHSLAKCWAIRVLPICPTKFNANEISCRARLKDSSNLDRCNNNVDCKRFNISVTLVNPSSKLFAFIPSYEDSNFL